MKLTFSVAGIAGILYGFALGTIVAVAMPYLESTTSLTTAQMSALVASAMFASIFTTLAGGPMAEWFGRRPCIIWSSLAYLAGVPFICLSGGEFSLIMTGLLMHGLAMGLQAIVVPLYLAETLPTEIRGRGAAVFQLFIITGILVSGFIGLVATWFFGAADAEAVSAASKAAAWKAIFSSVALPAAILFCISFFLKESPYWRRGAAADGEKTSAAAPRSGTLWQRKYVWPFVLVVILLVFHQGLGCSSVLGYSVKIFTLSGLSGAFANGADIAFKFVMLVMTAIACVLVERKGRKFLLVWGVALCLAGLLGAAASFFCIDHKIVQPSTVVGAIVTVSISVYVAGFAIGPGVCMWLILTEVLPGRIRAVGMSVASVADISVATLLQAVFLPFAERFGYGPLFSILLVCSVLYIIAIVLFLPETRGLSFDEIERFFEKKK